MHQAALRGELHELQHQLRANPAAVNAPDADGFLPLHLAVRAGQAAAAQLLLQHGSSAEDNNNVDFISPLQLGYLVGDQPLIDLLWRYSEEPFDCGSPPAAPGSPPPGPRCAGLLEDGAEQHAPWTGRNQLWRFSCQAGLPQLTVKLQLRPGAVGLRMAVRRGEPPTETAFDLQAGRPSREGLCELVVPRPEGGEWWVGIWNGPDGSYSGDIALSVCLGAGTAPAWIG